MIDPRMLGIDLAALRTLRLVYRLNSFTRAAAELGQKQSNVSYTIDRLRQALGDPLFVRQGNSIEPTARCRDIMASAERILSEAENLASPADFDPAAWKGTIVISSNYVGRTIILPNVIGRLRREAPGINVGLITGLIDAERHLLDRQADIAITRVSIDASGIRRRHLVRDRYVCFMDPENPLAGRDLDLETFAKANHLVFKYGEGWEPTYLQDMAARGLEPNRVVTTPDPADMVYLLAGTDLIATAPSRIAMQFAGRVAFSRCPIESYISLSMYWTEASHRSPQNAWLRGLIVEAAGLVSEPLEIPVPQSSRARPRRRISPATGFRFQPEPGQERRLTGYPLPPLADSR